MNTLPAQNSQPLIIAQMTQLSPQAIAARSNELTSAANWGLGVASFILSLMMLAALLRFIFNTGK